METNTEVQKIPMVTLAGTISSGIKLPFSKISLIPTAWVGYDTSSNTYCENPESHKTELYTLKVPINFDLTKRDVIYDPSFLGIDKKLERNKIRIIHKIQIEVEGKVAYFYQILNPIQELLLDEKMAIILWNDFVYFEYKEKTKEILLYQ